MEDLLEELRKAVSAVSYHNAAEGQDYFKEAAARAKAYERLNEIGTKVIEVYGEEEYYKITSKGLV
jgi:hypothetical protein